MVGNQNALVVDFPPSFEFPTRSIFSEVFSVTLLSLKNSVRRFSFRILGALALSTYLLNSIATAQIGVPDIKGGGGTPSNGGGTSTSVCPVRLVGRVEDVDGSGNLVCRYKIFIASNCAADQYKIDLPCSVNKVDCVSGACEMPNTSNLIPVNPPDPNAVPTNADNPMPNPMPANDPITIPGYAKAFASSALNAGIAAVPAGSTRTIVPIGANTTATVKYATLMQAGGDKHFKLIRLEITEADGSKTTVGSGFEIPSLPAGETAVPSVFRSLQNKTYQVEEYSNTGTIEWTYIVHESM